MTLNEYRLVSNKIAICLIPLFVLVVFCLFIFIDGSILANNFNMRWKGFALVAAIILPSSIPTFFYINFAIKHIKFYTEKSSFHVPFYCYLTCLSLFLIDCVLVTVMPIKFCGIIGQISFTICLLVVGDGVSWNMYVPANICYGFCVMLGSFLENKLTPSQWLDFAADIVYLPSYITVPTVWLIIVAVTLLNRINELDAVKNYERFKKLEYLNIHDPLTDCYNRSIITQKVFEDSGIIMIDIDHFKALNDEYGHSNGDKSLTFISQIIKNNIRRDKDYAIRYGGEEFIIVIKDLDNLKILYDKAESIRQAIETETKQAANDSKIMTPFTVSVGICIFNERLTIENNIKIADSFLYFAKNSGRNRVCGYN